MAHASGLVSESSASSAAAWSPAVVADNTSGDLQATINGFAAGALLVMLIDSMIPEAAHKAGRVAGLVIVLGFAGAAWLSSVS